MSMGNLSPFSSKAASPIPEANERFGGKMGTEMSRSQAEIAAGETSEASAKAAPAFVEPMDKALLKRLAEYCPLRLTEEERILLGVLEGALEHSEFTSNVDVSASMHYVRETWDKDDRIEREVLEFCRTLLGLSAANDYKTLGRETLGERLQDRESFFADCLEIGRRFKILNPDKMRDSYGKLLYLMMDACTPTMRQRLGMKLMRPVKTVGLLLKATAPAILDDDAIVDACCEITTVSQELSRRKAQAIQYLVDKYSSSLESEENVRHVIHSLEDALSFMRSNRGPVDKLIGYLKRNFDPRRESKDFALSLSLRRDARPRHQLSHDHGTQYTFVLQSLLLWREVMSDFFRLWIGAEEDLLHSKNGYHLMNTGQGMQRCQAAPTTRANMNSVLDTVQRKTDSWVGLKVVHLGDREVPNALVFIDKYTQIPRILFPIVRCLECVEGELLNNTAIEKYITQTFGSPERLVKLILADLFRGGFDGGGDLGGSCIDGRLTSLWNWSSLIEKKSYYPVFLLSGFLGFDGKF